MKTLLRSCFIASPSDSSELVLRNILSLQESGLVFDVSEDSSIWELIGAFTLTHSHPPDVQTLFAHFTREGNEAVVNRLHMLITIPALYQGDFISRVETKAADRRQIKWEDILRTASVISTTGLEVKAKGGQKSILKGPIDAARYVNEESHSILAPSVNTRLSGEVIGDTEAFKLRYERVKSDPLAGIGQFTGLAQLDQSMSGAKRWELWIHAAFTGGLKSTFALNWVYNQAIYYKHNSMYFSLEMPYDQVRNILYSMHTSHEKFKPIRHALGIQSDPDMTVGLEYGKIRDGTLNPTEEDFLFNYVVPDFNDEKNKYGKIFIEVADPDKDDFTIADLRMKAEVTYSKTPFSMIVVDHAGLMSSRKWVASTTERQNEVIRDLKKLAMSFHRGRGMAMVVLFQINREGYKRITKAQERSGDEGGAEPQSLYHLTDLSYANEAERSADIITATWVDEVLREKNLVMFQNLKSRDQAPFKPFYARVEWPCRRLFTLVDHEEMPEVEDIF